MKCFFKNLFNYFQKIKGNLSMTALTLYVAQIIASNIINNIIFLKINFLLIRIYKLCVMHLCIKNYVFLLIIIYGYKIFSCLYIFPRILFFQIIC